MDNRTMPFDDESYAEFERKMELVEYGPTTTILEQLTARGVELRTDDAIPDDELGRHLWQLLARLRDLRIELDHTDHLSDRELYRKLLTDIVPSEIAAHDEIGFAEHFQLLLCTGDEPQTSTYLRYFADENERGWWQKDNPDYQMPPQEDPPFNRDVLRPSMFGYPEALAWLDANWNVNALASKRFGSTNDARDFVKALYGAGAPCVAIDNIMFVAKDDWTPYADTLVVVMPEKAAASQALLEVCRTAGRPDQIADDPLRFGETGPKRIRLRWD